MLQRGGKCAVGMIPSATACNAVEDVPVVSRSGLFATSSVEVAVGGLIGDRYPRLASVRAIHTPAPDEKVGMMAAIHEEHHWTMYV
jgi:hypothetical protein